MDGHASGRYRARLVQMPQRRAHSRHPGKAGKGPLPKLPGRVLSRAAADRRNTPRATMRESSRQSHRAGRSSTTTQMRKTDTLVAGSTPPGWRRPWSRPCAQVRSWFCACVRIGVWACAGRPHLPRTERTPGPTRAHSGPQTAPCANVNGIAGPGAFYYTGRIPAADRRRRPDRITRSYTKCKPAEPQPVCTGATASVCHWAVRPPLFV